MWMWDWGGFETIIPDIPVNKWKIGLSAVNMATMAWVLIRTYLNSKLTHIYILATIMLLYPVFEMLNAILENWFNGCGIFLPWN
jgi:hypothetical protein